MAKSIPWTAEQMEEINSIMSALLDSIKERCQMINRTIVDDGYGGYKQQWTNGVAFDGYISADESTQSLTAQAQGVTAIYTVLTSRAINLQYHDVFRRLSDGKIFRVKTDGDDNKTPPISNLDLRSVRAEEWELPTDDE